MGGYGSGRRGYRATVEDCKSIDINRWMREGIVRAGCFSRGNWIWKNARTGKETSRIGYEVEVTDNDSGVLRLTYTFTDSGKEMDYKILLTSTETHFGGVRWWFNLSTNSERQGMP